MAKVYVVLSYITDYNDQFDDTEELKSLLEYSLDMGAGVHVSHIEESNEFEWNDDLPINQNKATTEDYEKYFK